MGATEESPVILEREVDVDQLSTSQKLHDHTGGDNGGDTKLHQGTTVGSHDSSEPVKRVGGVGRHDSVERNLGADKEDEQSGGSPQDLLLECDLGLALYWSCDSIGTGLSGR